MTIYDLFEKACKTTATADPYLDYLVVTHLPGDALASAQKATNYAQVKLGVQTERFDKQQLSAEFSANPLAALLGGLSGDERSTLLNCYGLYVPRKDKIWLDQQLFGIDELRIYLHEVGHVVTLPRLFGDRWAEVKDKGPSADERSRAEVAAETVGTLAMISLAPKMEGLKHLIRKSANRIVVNPGWAEYLTQDKQLISQATVELVAGVREASAI